MSSGLGPAAFGVDVHEDDGRVVVALHGELDLATADEFERALMPPLNDGRDVVLDLRGLGFIDSSGVRVVVKAHTSATENGCRLTVLRGDPDGPVGRVLEISGLNEILELGDES